MDLDNAHAEGIIARLDMLNKQMAKQNSFWHLFVTGIVYGIGFVVGSGIVATILLGLFGPWFAQIPWVQHAFTTGAALIQR